MLIERDLVPAFSIYLYCKSLPSTVPAQLPESSALLHSGAERVGYTSDYLKERLCQGCIYSKIILKLYSISMKQCGYCKLGLNQIFTFKNATFSLVVCNPPLC